MKPASRPPKSRFQRFGEFIARYGPPLVLVTCALAGLLLSEAEARVGGGQSYGGGGGSSSSGSSYGGGGSSGGSSGLFDVILWLCFKHPAIGLPLMCAFIGFHVYQHRKRRQRQEHIRVERRQQGAKQRSQRTRLEALLQRDPSFSEPLFIDFAQLVYARARRGTPAADSAVLRSYFSAAALAQLGQETRLTSAQDVIFGATQVTAIRLKPRWTTLRASFETNVTRSEGGQQQQYLVEEVWTFRRSADVVSPGPQQMQTLGCAACGSTLEPTPAGNCPNCDSARTGGATQWEVTDISIKTIQPLSAPQLHLGGGREPGLDRPSVRDPRLASGLRTLANRHADWSIAAFEQRAVKVFLLLQKAWTEQRWEQARPHQTDALFQVHRYWMERYRKSGLVNRIEKVQPHSIQVVKVTDDAWYESVTVRIWAKALDWTERVRDGEVVGGSKTEPREFSEYWTFIRSRGEPSGQHSGDLSNCPSCGAPLDKISMAGVCGYCDAKITGGKFDWILSRIEQDEAYDG